MQIYPWFDESSVIVPEQMSLTLGLTLKKWSQPNNLVEVRKQDPRDGESFEVQVHPRFDECRDQIDHDNWTVMLELNQTWQGIHIMNK